MTASLIVDLEYASIQLGSADRRLECIRDWTFSFTLLLGWRSLAHSCDKSFGSILQNRHGPAEELIFLMVLLQKRCFLNLFED